MGVVAIGAAGLGPALAADQVDEISDGLTAITILNINDFHGRIDGSVGLNFACTVVKEQANADAYAFLSAGDNIGASPFVSSSQMDNPTIDFLNALDLQATAVGNHEFDRTFPDLRDRVMPRSDFEHLGANVYLAGTSTPALPEAYVIDVAGVRVGIIGVVTEETPSLVIPSGVAMLEFGDPIEAVNRVAEELTTNDEADVIIAQYHEGATAGTPPSSLEEQVAAGGIFARIVTETSPLVDAIFTGHTHMSYAWDGPTDSGTRPVVQTGSYGGNLGKVVLGIDDSGSVVEYSSSLVSTSPPTDPELSDEENAVIEAEWREPCVTDDAYLAAKAIADTATTEAGIIGAEEVGSITADITTAFNGAARDDRLRESTLGNLTANAWLWAMNQEGRSGADIGIMNPGGLRAELIYGEDGIVTLAEVAGVHPFANTMQTVDITGAQVITLLEQQWQPTGASRPFLKLGLSDNVRYTYDPDAPNGSRITGVWIDGAPIDPTATFTVASGVFLIDGGDNFTVLREGTNKRDSGMIDTDAFIDYFRSYSPVSPNFEKNGVAVSGDLPVEASAGDTVTFTISDTDLTSLGAPSNTSFTIYLGEEEVGSAPIESTTIEGLPIRTGQSTVSFTIPEGFGGPGVADVSAAGGLEVARAAFVPGRAAAAPAVGVLTADPVDTAITLVAEPSGTTVRLQASITPADTTPTDPPTETPDPTDPPTETPGPTDSPTQTPDPTSSAPTTSTPSSTGAPAKGGLARTGAEIAPVLAAIALLLLLGSGLVVATRRRRAQH